MRDLVAPAQAVFVNAKLEEEMSGMDTAEKMEFLKFPTASKMMLLPS